MKYPTWLLNHCIETEFSTYSKKTTSSLNEFRQYKLQIMSYAMPEILISPSSLRKTNLKTSAQIFVFHCLMLNVLVDLLAF